MKTWLLLGLVTLSYATRAVAADSVGLRSPGNLVRAVVDVDDSGRLNLQVSRNDQAVLAASPLGIVVDKVDLGLGVVLGAPTEERHLEQYAWLGAKNTATNRCTIVRLPVRHRSSDLTWTLELRLFDDGVAYRYHIPGSGRRRVEGEASAWTLPEGSVVWFQTNTGDYEGVYESNRPEMIRLAPEGETERRVHLGPPVTVELPSGGYALLTEAALFDYSGMTLRPTRTPTLEAAFEDDPSGWEAEGPITSPWRVTIAVPDLNALVNSDVVPNLGEPPDPTLFPRGAATEWVQPGRALITWTLFGNDGAQWYRQPWFVDQCVALGCEYLLVDAGWLTEKWGWLADGGDPWARLDALCEQAAEKGVGIFVWRAYPEGRDDGPGLTDPAVRQAFFRRCRQAGVKGIKIDFLNSERRDIVEFYETALRETAEQQLMINFHGANKPTGETRPWPHEISREGIREQEYLLWDQLPRAHYAALPFTRMAVGHSDFLPTYVREKYLKNTRMTFQMALAIIATSPFLCWPDHPDDYRRSAFIELIRRLPVVWDETRVLDGSAIGRLAAFARRSGNDWYVGVINGTEEEIRYTVDWSFLGAGPYVATFYREAEPSPTGVAVESDAPLRAGDRTAMSLPPGGGFVGWVRRG